MSAFTDACAVEARAWGHLEPFFRAHAKDCSVVEFNKGALARRLQLTYGDLMLNSAATGETISVECKSENRWTGNLFIETWSNRATFRRGWLDHLDATLLAYFFLDVKILYLCNFIGLKQWAFGREPGGGFYRCREVRQGRYEQSNDTWGRIVPIAGLMDDQAINMRAFDLDGPCPGSALAIGQDRPIACERQGIAREACLFF